MFLLSKNILFLSRFNRAFVASAGHFCPDMTSKDHPTNENFVNNTAYYLKNSIIVE